MKDLLVQEFTQIELVIRDLFTVALMDHKDGIVARLTKHTTKSYLTGLNDLEQFLNGRPLTPDSAQEWLDDIALTKSASTVNTRRAALMSLVSWVETRLNNTVATTQSVMHKKTEALSRCAAFKNISGVTVRGQKLGNWLTKEDAKCLIENMPEQYKLAVKIMFGTGLRVGEVCDLTEKNLVTRNGRILITLQGKGKKHRTVPVPDWLVQDMTGFTGVDAKPGTISKNITRAGEKCLGEKVSAHDCRRSFARWIWEADPARLVELSKLLGHATLEQTLAYVNAEVDLESPLTNLVTL